MAGIFPPSTAMYTVTTRINQQTLTPLTFDSWQSAYKYLRACEYLWNPEINPKIDHYSLCVHNSSGIEIKKITIY
jgi:hypothetical protein